MLQCTKNKKEMIFLLSCDSMQEVLGRCAVDIRVCASPGRDRDVDEKRLKGEDIGTGTPDASNKPAPPSTRRGRKRGREKAYTCMDMYYNVH